MTCILYLDAGKGQGVGAMLCKHNGIFLNIVPGQIVVYLPSLSGQALSIFVIVRAITDDS